MNELQGKFDPEEYAQYVQPIAAVNSVEQFWNVYRHLKMPCGRKNFPSKTMKWIAEFQEKIDIHFFKKGIKPVWEDESNVKGGKWILRLKKVRRLGDYLTSWIKQWRQAWRLNTWKSKARNRDRLWQGRKWFFKMICNIELYILVVNQR